MAQEGQSAAESALEQLVDDLATLEGRLQFDFSADGLVTSQAVSFAEAVIRVLNERELELQSAWERVSQMSAELQAICGVMKTDVEVQTDLITCVVSCRAISSPLPCVMVALPLWWPEEKHPLALSCNAK